MEEIATRPVPVLTGGAAAAGVSTVTPHTAGARLLVIDDQALVRRVAREVLVRAGFVVQEAGDGEEALAIVQAGAPFDAVLLDVTMPRMSGLETFRRLQRLQPHLRVVLTSGYCEADAAAPFGSEGIAGFVQKPFTSVALVQAIREAINGQRTVTRA